MTRERKLLRAARAALCAALVLGAVAFSRDARAARGDCGQPFSDGAQPVIKDCLWLLRVVAGIGGCEPICICDVNDSGAATASDALICLKHVLGVPIDFDCSCPATTTTTTSTTTTTVVAAGTDVR